VFCFALPPSDGFRRSLVQMLRPGADARFPPNLVRPQKIRPLLLEANPHHVLYRHCSLPRHPNGPPRLHHTPTFRSALANCPSTAIVPSARLPGIPTHAKSREKVAANRPRLKKKLCDLHARQTVIGPKLTRATRTYLSHHVLNTCLIPFCLPFCLPKVCISQSI